MCHSKLKLVSWNTYTISLNCPILSHLPYVSSADKALSLSVPWLGQSVTGASQWRPSLICKFMLILSKALQKPRKQHCHMSYHLIFWATQWGVVDVRWSFLSSSLKHVKEVVYGSAAASFFHVSASRPYAHATHAYCTDLPMVGWRKWRDRLYVAVGSGLVSAVARHCQALLRLQETGIMLLRWSRSENKKTRDI
jgi:hypothetical protein